MATLHNKIGVACFVVVFSSVSSAGVFSDLLKTTVEQVLDVKLPETQAEVAGEGGSPAPAQSAETVSVIQESAKKEPELSQYEKFAQENGLGADQLIFWRANDRPARRYDVAEEYANYRAPYLGDCGVDTKEYENFRKFAKEKYGVDYDAFDGGLHGKHQYLLDGMNADIWMKHEYKMAVQYVPSSKSEFEKTEDYNARITKEKAQFALIPQYANHPEQCFLNVVHEYLHRYMGKLLVVYQSHVYDPDAEKLVVNFAHFDPVDVREGLTRTFKSRPVELVMPFEVKFNISPEQAKEVLSLWTLKNAIPVKIGVEYVGGDKLVLRRANFYYSSKGALSTRLDLELPYKFTQENMRNYLAGMRKSNESSPPKPVVKNAKYENLSRSIREDVYECNVIKNNLASLAMSKGYDEAYQSGLSYKARYSLCFK